MKQFNLGDKVTIIQPTSHYFGLNGLVKDLGHYIQDSYGIKMVPGDSSILWFDESELKTRTT